MEPQYAQDNFVPRFIGVSWLLYVPIAAFSFVVGKETFVPSDLWELFLSSAVVFVPFIVMVVIGYFAKKRSSELLALVMPLAALLMMGGVMYGAARADQTFFIVKTNAISCPLKLELRQDANTGLPGCYYKDVVNESKSASPNEEEITWACGKPEDPRNQCPEGTILRGWVGDCKLVCK